LSHPDKIKNYWNGDAIMKKNSRWNIADGINFSISKDRNKGNGVLSIRFYYFGIYGFQKWIPTYI
jgi:hypothetical protein